MSRTSGGYNTLLMVLYVFEHKAQHLFNLWYLHISVISVISTTTPPTPPPPPHPPQKKKKKKKSSSQICYNTPCWVKQQYSWNIAMQPEVWYVWLCELIHFARAAHHRGRILVKQNYCLATVSVSGGFLSQSASTPKVISMSSYVMWASRNVATRTHKWMAAWIR